MMVVERQAVHASRCPTTQWSSPLARLRSPRLLTAPLGLVGRGAMGIAMNVENERGEIVIAWKTPFETVAFRFGIVGLVMAVTAGVGIPAHSQQRTGLPRVGVLGASSAN